MTFGGIHGKMWSNMMKGDSIFMNFNLHRIYNVIKMSFINLKLGSKLFIFYLLVLIISIVSSAVIYQKMYAEIVASKLVTASTQVLQSIDSSIESDINVLLSYSKMILSDESVQEQLSTNSVNNIDVVKTREITKRLEILSDANPIISSIYIVENSGYYYDSDKVREKKIRQDYKNSRLYKEVLGKKGGHTVSLNADSIFELKEGEHYISVARQIRSIDTMLPIGVIIINISADYLKNSYKNVTNKYNSDISLVDPKGETIISFNSERNHEIFKLSTDNRKDGSLVKYKGDTYVKTKYINSKYGWSILGIMTYNQKSQESKAIGNIVIIVLAVNSLLIFGGTLFFSRLITIPIKKLIKSMKGVEKGEFVEVSISTGKDEIGKLKECYNIMILEIKKLIIKVIDEQTVKRKAELEALQAQIKPHFLYNTIETARSFALTGKNQEVNAILRSLGNYYRYSLSKGSEIITIREEIEIIKNYMNIQKSRYGEILDVEYRLDEDVLEYKILKLVLQPLVENSLYHGIKPMGTKGLIKVAVVLENEEILLTVADNGVGMDQDTIDIVLGVKGDYGKKSFGLKSTIERLKIFYGVDNIVSIKSPKGEGTKIIISIPLERMK